MNNLGVILSPSSQPRNKCIICQSEETHCRHLAQIVKNYLANYHNVETRVISKQVATDSETKKLRNIVDESNAFVRQFRENNISRVLHIALHTNAFDSNTKGNLIFHYPNNAKTYELSRILRPRFDAVTKIESNKGLYELNETLADSIYFETRFHDNLADAWDFHRLIHRIGNTIASGALTFASL